MARWRDGEGYHGDVMMLSRANVFDDDISWKFHGKFHGNFMEISWNSS